MNTKDWFLVIVELVVWYGFIYYVLYAMKNPVNLYFGALILLVLAYIGIVSCPWFRKTKAFKELVKE